MKVSQLTREEQLALVALLKLVVQADHGTSVGEAAQLRRNAAEMGGMQAWMVLASEVEQRFPTEADVRRYAPTVTRPKARRLIYSRLVDIAKVGKLVQEEAEILRWVATLWELDPRW